MFEEFNYIHKNRFDYAQVWKSKTINGAPGSFYTYALKKVRR